MLLETYRASDRRCYNGAMCSDLQREANHTKALEKRMKEIDRTAGVCYFPVEGKYLAFTNSNILENPDLEGPPKILTGNFFVDKQAAIIEAIKVLEKDEGRP